MPIALLLFESTLDFAFGGHQMSPWVHLVAMEEKLIDRARSAFLVKWFGRNLPLQGFYLKVAIDNLQALRDRYLAMKQSVQPELSGPNLTEPLAGVVGQIAGMMFSPQGVVLVAVAAVTVKKVKTWVGVLLEVLSPIISAVGSGIAIGVGLPIGFIGGLFLGGIQQEDTGAVIALMGALAQLLNSTSLFIEQLLGPREKVANPLLRQHILPLFDHMAGLGVQLLGFIAVVVNEIGPLLLPLALQVGPFTALLGSVLDTLLFIWEDLLRQLGLVFDPKFTVLRTIDVVVDVLAALFPMLIHELTVFFSDGQNAFLGLFTDLKGSASVPADKSKGIAAKASSGFLGFFEAAGNRLDDAVNKSPLMLQMNAAKVFFKIAAVYLDDDSGSSKDSGSSSPSTFPDFPKLKITPAAKVEAALGGAPRIGLDGIVPLGKLNDFLTRQKQGGPLPLGDAAAKQLERARHPGSVFAAERGEPHTELGGPTPKAAPPANRGALAELGHRIASQLESQQHLRSLFADVIGRILPPESRTSLADSFYTIDAAIDAAPNQKKTDFPVRDLPDNGLLRPVVRRLTLQSSTAGKLELEDFADWVRKALLAQTYPAAAAAGGSYAN
jgi:hypothetical protein